MLPLLDRISRKTLALGLRCPGSLPLVRRLRASSAAIVMYHGVTAQSLPVPNWCQLPADAFASQLDYLTRHYSPLPLAEIVGRLALGKPLPPQAVALTFDDGFRNVYTTALPLLQRYQVPATVFLVTSLIGTRQPAWPERLFQSVSDYPGDRLEWQGRAWNLKLPQDRNEAYRDLARHLKRLPHQQKENSLCSLLDQLGAAREIDADSPLATLDWDEIHKMQQSGLIEFGSHTHTHPMLSRCSLEMQEAELRTSRDLLRERLNQADLLFAYPNGTADDFTAETRQTLIALGYRGAVSTLPGINSIRTDRYTLKRVAVGNDTTLSQFASSLTGIV